MNNTQTSEAFVKGDTNGKSSHHFIEGRTIYSYGYHFPLAIRLDNNIFILNEDRYSNSTARHKSLIKRAVGTNQSYFLGTNVLKQIISEGFTTLKEIMVAKILK